MYGSSISIGLAANRLVIHFRVMHRRKKEWSVSRYAARGRAVRAPEPNTRPSLHSSLVSGVGILPGSTELHYGILAQFMDIPEPLPICEGL
jgi:hypothetical protein